MPQAQSRTSAIDTRRDNEDVVQAPDAAGTANLLWPFKAVGIIGVRAVHAGARPNMILVLALGRKDRGSTFESKADGEIERYRGPEDGTAPHSVHGPTETG